MTNLYLKRELITKACRPELHLSILLQEFGDELQEPKNELQKFNFYIKGTKFYFHESEVGCQEATVNYQDS